MVTSLPHDIYINPFSTRYGSKEMSYLFSAECKILTFRRLWIALAKAERKLGLPISAQQIAQMEKWCASIDFSAAASYEKQLRHDVMAHIHAFGDACPEAKPIIHLGATSCYVTDNADLILFKEALALLLAKMDHVLRLLADLAEKEASTPCLGYTHFQSAQPTTFGKRFCLWLQDFFWDAQEWHRLHEELPFLGAKGATGTQSSFLTLLGNNQQKVEQLDVLIAKQFGFAKTLPIAGQTYTRKLDMILLNAFSSFAASAHKMGTDLRLLAHDGEVQEVFGKKQVGSSAMPYKKNPIYAERICGLSRFVISLAQNPAYTAATQWLERSLDDSSNRRFVMPEAFLGTDALLNLLAHLLANVQCNPTIAAEKIEKELPHLIMENLLMKAVTKGGDRQLLHEKLRKLSTHHSLNDILSHIEKDPDFHLSRKEIKPLLKTSSLIGMAPQQVFSFLKTTLRPYLSKKKRAKPLFPAIEV